MRPYLSETYLRPFKIKQVVDALLFFIGSFFIMNDSLQHRLTEYWGKKRIRVFFNKDIEYWGYSRTKFIPFSSLLLDIMESEFGCSDNKLIISITNTVKWTKDPVISGGCFIKQEMFDVSRNSFYKSMGVFKKLNIFIPFGDDYYVFNEKYIYKIRNKSNKISN